MHCPSCGQQQVSNETKFCSRCGMPLGLVSEVLSHGGFLPQLAQLNRKNIFFNKKNGVVLGILWLIFMMFCTAFFGIVGAQDELIGITAITGVFGSFMILLASLIFLPSSRPFLPGVPQYGMPQQPGQLPNSAPVYPAEQQALPPQQTIPVSVYAAPKTGAWRDTNDLEPASVTDATTRHLKRDQAN